MYSVRFEREHLNAKLLSGSMGEDFQRFVHEILSYVYPGLHRFPADGKDGCIDLFAKSANSNVFVECKYIGSSSLPAAQSRWREVAKHLKSHISGKSQPTAGQSQYWPWYSTDPPVQEFLFCISSALSNRHQVDLLEREIRNFFTKTAESHDRLAHLASLSVRVLDWSDLCNFVSRYPAIMLRWFPRSRPLGLVPIDELRETNSFRSYLYSDLLPYYGRRDHLKLHPAPSNSVIPDEEQLLLELSGDDLAGLIITGKGGLGKTRLTLEIGRLARRKGWIVLRAHGNLLPETVTQFTEMINTYHNVLIVADYIEVQREFIEFVEALIALNDTYKLRLRYIANCRPSYYRSVAAIPRHRQVNLSPGGSRAEVSWTQNFQQQTVCHILKSSHLDPTQAHLRICRNRAVFAVFMSYLARTRRSEDLTELLEESDFGSWVARRLHLTFGNIATARQLALLMALFPLSEDSIQHPSLESQIPVLERLAADGWVERVTSKDGSTTWIVAHDVLADQIVLSYLDSIPDTIELFVQHVLTESAKTANFRSALVTMQRIADQSSLEHVNWFALLSRYVSRNVSGEGVDRASLVRTSLLVPIERIKLLGANTAFWAGAEKEPDFQNAIGWLSRWVQEVGSLSIDQEARATLIQWIERVVQHASESNYALTWGLRLSPELARDAAFKWISTRPDELQTHYLIVAWLEKNLGSCEIELAVWQWTSFFMYTRELSFVVAAWLDADGNLDLVKEPLLAWLEEFGSRPEAHFIYRAWLNAGGELKAVSNYLNNWLAQYGADLRATSVYRSLLKDKEGAAIMGAHIERWLLAHCEMAEAAIIYRSLLVQCREIKLVRQYIVRWLDVWKLDSRAESVYSAWLRVRGDLEVISSHLKSWLRIHEETVRAGFIYRYWFRCGGESEWMKPHLMAWIQKNSLEPVAGSVYTAWLAAYGEPDSIVSRMLEWLERFASNADADFVFKSWLQAGGTFSMIASHVTIWLEANWSRAEILYFVEFIAHQNPLICDPIEDLLRICLKKLDDENSLRCLTKLTIALRETQQDHLAADSCARVLDFVLSPRRALSKVEHRLAPEILGLLLTSPQFSFGDKRECVNNLLVRWLRHDSVLSGKAHTTRQAQRPEYLHRIRELISKDALNVKNDRAGLKFALKWMNSWNPDIKEQLSEDLRFLSIDYPDPKLWNLIRLADSDASGQDIKPEDKRDATP